MAGEGNDDAGVRNAQPVSPGNTHGSDEQHQAMPCSAIRSSSLAGMPTRPMQTRTVLIFSAAIKRHTVRWEIPQTLRKQPDGEYRVLPELIL